ncbi:MAG TPA: isoprenoid biosynthesis glyoxalase ElbB [Planctomycetes bacterium]|nr:isoprenoid biosynthesis glyoxalase ElbB [Planctomycetota bacterium]
MVKIGVCLSGCGFLDGSEIHEATLSLYHLDRHGVETHVFAPDKPQKDVVDHRTGQAVPGESRNVLSEGARIARGVIEPLSALRTQELDGLILPGGYGVAKNLCGFAEKGVEGEVLPELQQILRELHSAAKPIGAICISPVLVAMAFRGTEVAPLLTIGEDPSTAQAIEALGGRHMVRGVEEIALDSENRIVSTPAYMYDARISEVAVGIGKLVDQVLALTQG